MPQMITYADAHSKVDWLGAVEALRTGHTRDRATVQDVFMGPGTETLLNRSAFIPGIGFGVKAVTVFDANPARGLDTVQGAMMVFDPTTGSLSAVIDSKLVTEFKTAGDSALGARLLARPDSRSLLIVGAGTLARSLVRAYSAVFTQLETITIWARDSKKALAFAEDMATEGFNVEVAHDLAAAVGAADIVSTATMARTPILSGEWLSPGTHVDLIGAYKADMREADDEVLRRGRLFVDSRDTTLHHIGELMIPLKAGVIAESDVLGDLYDIIVGSCGRASSDEITVFKNGGGAHLDTMIAAYIASVA